MRKTSEGKRTQPKSRINRTQEKAQVEHAMSLFGQEYRRGSILS
jgi:hypothetical protein